MDPAQTAEEAARRMLDSKKLSNKINYDVLADLFNTDSIHQEYLPSHCTPHPYSHSHIALNAAGLTFLAAQVYHAVFLRVC